jgi:type III pantothenate kinase
MLESIPHVLACDCGNTHVRFAHVHGEEIGETRTFRQGELDSLPAAVAELWEQVPQPRKIVAASVNPAALKALEAAVHQATQQHVLAIGRDLPLPMETRVSKPEQVGSDRYCAAVAAFDRLGTACVVADFGSAVTIDCVDGEGVFLGGAILPGLRMGARALAEETAQLPRVEPMQPDWVFGADTQQAIAGGLVFGLRGAMRELVEAYATQLGTWPTVIATGGDAELLYPHPGEEGLIQAVVDDLTLRGVAIAYYRTLLPKTG